MSNAALKKAMDNAEASINMEGLYITNFCKHLCEKLLKKEITFEEYLRQITEYIKIETNTKNTDKKDVLKKF